MGGSSIELVRIQQALEQMTGQEIPIVDLFRLPNIMDVAHYIDARLNDRSDPAAIAEEGSETRHASAARENRALRRKRVQPGEKADD